MTRTTPPVTVHRRALAAALLAALVITVVGTAAPTATAAGDPSAAPSGDPGTEPTVRLIPDTLPADIPGGTIETPLGAARWVHLSGEQDVLPPLTSMAGPDGLVWLDAGRPADGFGGSRCEPVKPRLWTSADVTSTRTERPLPVDEGWTFLTFDGDEYWLSDWMSDMASGTLWRSSDLASWEGMDGSTLLAPDPPELWQVRFGWPVTSAGVTLVPVSHEVRDLGRLLGFPDRYVFLEAAGPDRYDVIEYRSRNDDPRLATLLVEPTTTGIRLTDEAGATITELTGVGPEFVETWASSGIGSYDELALVDGSRLTPVTKPGQTATSSWSPSLELQLLPLDPGFMAFELGEDSIVRTWRSADGRSWLEGGPVAGPDGQPLRAQSLWAGTQDGRHVVSVSPIPADLDGSAPHPELRSVDGMTWTAAPDPPAGEYSYRPVRLPAGYIAWSDYGAWSVSTDGSTWEEAPALREVIPRTTPNGNGSVSWGSIGNALLFAITADCGPRDLWIVEFDQEAARAAASPTLAETLFSPSPQAAASAAPVEVLPVDWVTVEGDPTFKNIILSDAAIAPGGGAVAVGFRKPRGFEPREGRILSSVSGDDWQMRTLPGTSGDYPFRVVATEAGFTAIGARMRPGEEAGPVGSIWTSSDGVDWSIVNFDGADFDQLVSVGDRLAILGTSHETPTVWTSRSGGPWEAATVAAGDRGFSPDQLAISADGIYLTFDGRTGKLYRSDDGTSFTPVDLPGDILGGADLAAIKAGKIRAKPGDPVNLQLAPWSSGFLLLVQHDRVGSLTAWASPDGRTWHDDAGPSRNVSGWLDVDSPVYYSGASAITFLQSDGALCTVSLPAMHGFQGADVGMAWNEDGGAIVWTSRERYEDPVIWHGEGVRCG